MRVEAAETGERKGEFVGDRQKLLWVWTALRLCWIA
jgi:hypothetical protein